MRVLLLVVTSLALLGCPNSLVKFPLDAGADAGVEDAGLGCVADQPCTTNGSACRVGTTACVGGVKSCIDGANAPAATACAGGVCDGSGQCVPCVAGQSCTPDGGAGCQQGRVDCSTGAPSCTSIVVADAGTTCGTDRVCTANGTCEGCTANVACSGNTNACRPGLTSCASGASTCVDSTLAFDAGTSCGTDRVCSASASCDACTTAATCSTNPTACRVGAISCTTGAPTCLDTPTNAAPGASCGQNQVCNAGGNCVACSAGASCVPAGTVCQNGTISCSTGAPVCMASGNMTDGTACTGGTCSNGACLPTVSSPPAGAIDLSTTALSPNRTCAEAISYSVIALPSSTTATLSTTPVMGCLSAGDAVLLINLQGSPGAVVNVGNYEFLTVASVNGAGVTFTQPKARFYGSASNSDANIGVGATDQKVMLQRAPSFWSLTVPTTTTLTAAGFDGLKGGVLPLRSVTLDLQGALLMNAKGYRGGVVGNSSRAAEAEDGWVAGVEANGVAGSGFNGGNGGGVAPGGGNGGAGATTGVAGLGRQGGGGGGDGWFSASQIASAGGGGGAAAFTHTRVNLSPGMLGRAHLGPGGTQGGGGGGGGGYFGGGTAATAGSGGLSNGTGGPGGVTWAPAGIGPGGSGGGGSPGGGIILIESTSLNVGVSGSMSASGAPGGAGGTGGQGGGGVDGSGGAGAGGQGAAGGSINVNAATRTGATDFARARGGNGGRGGDGNRTTSLGLGGAGGAGGVFVTGGETGANGTNGTNLQTICTPDPCVLVNGGGGKGGPAGTAGRVLIVP